MKRLQFGNTSPVGGTRLDHLNVVMASQAHLQRLQPGSTVREQKIVDLDDEGRASEEFGQRIVDDREFRALDVAQEDGRPGNDAFGLQGLQQVAVRRAENPDLVGNAVLCGILRDRLAALPVDLEAERAVDGAGPQQPDAEITVSGTQIYERVYALLRDKEVDDRPLIEAEELERERCAGDGALEMWEKAISFMPPNGPCSTAFEDCS